MDTGEGPVAHVHVVRADGEFGDFGKVVSPETRVQILPDDSADIEKQVGALHGRGHRSGEG